MPNLRRQPDPLHMMARLQAQQALDAPGPTSYAKLFGDAGHIRLLGKQLLANERAFRIAIARWYRQLGNDILQAIRRSSPYTYLQAARAAVTDKHRAALRKIVTDHVKTSALLSAALEWAIHQTKPSAKAVIDYVAKGAWSIARSLPRRLMNAVKLTIASVLAAFSPEAIIEPTLDRVGHIMVATVAGAAPDERQAARIAADVKAEVFNRAATERTAAGVATTTNTQAANAGTAAAGGVLAEAHLVNAKRWMTLHGTGEIDARVRPSHRKANGQTVGMIETYTLDMPGKDGGTEACEYPGDANLSEGNKRHCRCLSIYLWVEERDAA
jgi:hypothetical protein